MFKKIFNIFSFKKKDSFRVKVKKEKAKYYMFRANKTRTFFPKRKNKLQLNINFNKVLSKKIILSFILFLLFVSIVSITYIFKGGYFSIKNIKIFIKDNITDENIAYKSLNIIRNKSIFLESNDYITKRLLDYQKNIQKVKINRVLPDTLEIDVYSYPILLNVLYLGKQYYITSNGVLIPKRKKFLDKKDNNIVLEIIDKKANKYKILSYNKLFNQEYIYKIYSLINSFRDNLINLKIKKILLFKQEKELHIITNNDTIFIFSLEEDIKKQLKKLIIYNKEKSSNLKYIYIDLRVKNKIFVCPYKNEYQCRKNYNRIYK